MHILQIMGAHFDKPMVHAFRAKSLRMCIFLWCRYAPKVATRPTKKQASVFLIPSAQMLHE